MLSLRKKLNKNETNKTTNLILHHIFLCEVLTSIISQRVQVINMQITKHSEILKNILKIVEKL